MFTRIQLPPVLDAETVPRLHAALDAVTTGVLVLEGADGVFCRGMDLDGVGNEGAVASAEAFARCLAALRFAPSPSIAIVDGAALGGGLGLAAACDVVLATPRATFGLPELLFGLLPAIVLPVLLERVTPQRLRLLAMRAYSLTADQAHALGLVDEVIPSETLPAATRRWTRTLSRPNPNTVAILKRYADPSLRYGLKQGARVTAERVRDPAVLAAARRFEHEGVAPWLA
jgi:enoyl-CoA hydratase/carnithine racemase